METGVSIIFLIIIIIIGVLVYVIYKIGAFWNSLPITDCGKFTAERGTVGTTHGPKCGPGKEMYGGVCYDDTWTAKGGRKTAVCTVSYGTYHGVKSAWAVWYLYQGDPCPMFGEGYHKTAIYTCQKDGSVTAAQYCRRPSIPRTCEKGWDYYGSICYKEACPEGYYRSAICTCAKKA